MSLVRASFRKQVSDGNYGSESAECTLEVDLDTRALTDPSETESDVAKGLLAMCRRRVLDELRASNSSMVRRGAEYHPLAPDDDRAVSWALSNANAEEHDIRAQDDEVPF